MRPVDIGVDAARILSRPGSGRVRAVFSRALYLQRARRPGRPRHRPGRPAARCTCAWPPCLRCCRAARSGWTADSLRIGDHAYQLDAAGLVAAAAACIVARRAPAEQRGDWLPDLGPALDLGSAGDAGLPGERTRRPAPRRPARLRRPGRRPRTGTHPGRRRRAGRRAPGGMRDPRRVGDRSVDASAVRSAGARRMTSHARSSPARPEAAASSPPTTCSHGLADADRRAVQSAAEELRRFGSSSGAALTYGIRTALLELPTAPRVTALDCPAPCTVAYSERRSRIVDAVRRRRYRGASAGRTKR